MVNYFENMSNENLKKCYKQRLEGKGIYGESPMREIIDQYSELSANCLMIAEIALLDEIAKRWYNLI